MTLYQDNLESGILGLTSALSTRAGASLNRQRIMQAASNGVATWTGFLPYDAVGIDAKIFIMEQGSAATSDRIIISTSAGGTVLNTFASMGSATGVLTQTTTGLGTRTVVASASFLPAPATNPEGSDIPFQVVLSSVDLAAKYGVLIEFRRRFKPGT